LGNGVRKTRLTTIYGANEPLVVLADHLLGLRGWALILYGALPANLAVIGALKLDPGIEAPGWPILGLLALPVVITSLLIRNRQREWYVSSAFLNARSVLITILILLCSMAIYGAAQLAKGTFVWVGAPPFWTPQFALVLRESILFGVASLVVSSTLFMVLLTKGADLPGLPSSKTVETLAVIRQELRIVMTNTIWTRCPEKQEDTFKNSINKLTEELEYRHNLNLPSFARLSLDPLAFAIDDLAKVTNEIEEIESGDLRMPIWKVYFALDEELTPSEKEERQRWSERRNSLQSLKKTRWSV